MNTRLLGILSMLGGASLSIIEIRHVMLGTILNGTTIDRPDEILYALWSIGAACAFWAIYALAVTGSNKVMRLVPFIAIAGFVVLFIGSVMEALGLVTPMTDPLAGIGFILILAGTLLTAILVLITRTWAGWRKFTPLICLLSIPVMILLSMVVGEVATVLFGLSWVLLGYAVFTSNTNPALQTAPV